MDLSKSFIYDNGLKDLADIFTHDNINKFIVLCNTFLIVLVFRHFYRSIYQIITSEILELSISQRL